MRPFAFEVAVQGDALTRDALVVNEAVLTHAINHVGSRVAVDVLDLHLRALYEHMKLPISSTFETLKDRVEHLDHQPVTSCPCMRTEERLPTCKPGTFVVA